jgi:opacity protein-like surface antigen
MFVWAEFQYAARLEEKEKPMFRDSMILATALLGLGVPAAQAMDLPPPVVIGQEVGPLSIGQGWYIRGDFGYNYSVSASGKPTYAVYDSGTDSYSTHGFDNARLSSDFSMAAGIGYQFNDYLRTDLTLDYFTGSLNGRTGWESPCTPGFGTATSACRFDDARFSALGVLANGYVDLGTYWGITPYVGAGAGVTNLEWGTVNQTVVCSAAVQADCNGINSATAAHEGLDSWRFTYALMAGAAYDLTAHTKIDFGYRYSKIAGGDMFSFSTYEQALGAFGVKGKDKGLGRHEFRAGLRLTTW